MRSIYQLLIVHRWRRLDSKYTCSDSTFSRAGSIILCTPDKVYPINYAVLLPCLMFLLLFILEIPLSHDDVIKLEPFPRYWPFVRGIHRSPVNSPHKGQGRGALMFSFICTWINGWVNIGEAGDVRRHCAHYDVIAYSSRLVDKHRSDSMFVPVPLT